VAAHTLGEVGTWRQGEMVKVYLDTCVLSRIFDAGFKEEFLDAIEALCDHEDIDLVTSSKTLQELLNTPDKKRRVAFKLLYRIVTKVPSADLIYFIQVQYRPIRYGMAQHLGGHAWVEDPLFAGMKEIFDPDDAEHIFQAAKNGCEYFLTVDHRTILHRAREHRHSFKQLCPGLKIVDPLELTNSLAD
jgi:predicted nucleic acid-binding protein